MHPAAPLTDFPILKPSTTVGKRACELHQEWCDQHARVGRVETDYVAAQARLKETEAQMRDVLQKRELSEATDAEAKAAEDAHAAAKAEAEAPWQERARAAVRAAEQRRQTYEAFIDENLDDLVAELEADAKVAVETIRKAAQTMADGVAAWRAVNKRSVDLIRPAQLVSTQSIPRLSASAEQAAQSAHRLLEDGDGLALPVPERRHLDQRLIDLGLPTKRQYVWKGRTGPTVAKGES